MENSKKQLEFHESGMISKIVYGGWVDIPNGVSFGDAKRALRDIGVDGFLKLSKDRNSVEGMVCIFEVVEKLRREWPTFWAPAFTGYNLYTGENTKEQCFWRENRNDL